MGGPGKRAVKQLWWCGDITASSLNKIMLLILTQTTGKRPWRLLLGSLP